MPGLTQQLLMYYLGVGFAVLLAWAAALPNRQLDPDDAHRYLRRATAAAIVGLAHPALALAARDIVGQVGLDLPQNHAIARTHQRTTTLVNALTVASLFPSPPSSSSSGSPSRRPQAPWGMAMPGARGVVRAP